MALTVIFIFLFVVFQTAGVMKITNHLEQLSVFERTADSFRIGNPNIKVVHALVASIDTVRKIVHFKDCQEEGGAVPFI